MPFATAPFSVLPLVRNSIYQPFVFLTIRMLNRPVRAFSRAQPMGFKSTSTAGCQAPARLGGPGLSRQSTVSAMTERYRLMSN